MPLLELVEVRKRYGDVDTGRRALDGVSLTIDRGERVAILGASGSGKSTLLQVLGGLDLTYEGRVLVDGSELRTLRDGALAALRHRMFGFVFQSFHLVPSWTVRANVALPASFAPKSVPGLKARVDEVLAKVGLAGRGDDLPTALSGGQRQRVAIARALLLRPPVLLCDEPTGSLDVDTGEQILTLFSELIEQEKMTLIIVTHEERAAAIASRVVRLANGKVVSDQAGHCHDPRTAAVDGQEAS